MSYSDQSEMRRRLTSSTGPKTPHGPSPNVGAPPSNNSSDARRRGSHASQRPSKAQYQQQQQQPWNSSVRTSSTAPATLSASTLEVSITGRGRRFLEEPEGRPIRRRLAPSLDEEDESHSRRRAERRPSQNGWNLNGSNLHRDADAYVSHDDRRDSRALFRDPRYYQEEDDAKEYTASSLSQTRTQSRQQHTTPVNCERRHTGALEEAGASREWAHDAQAQLYAQLQDVAVQLSRAAVEQRRKAAHTKKRLEAFARLVREQDAMIDELRSANASLESERNALLEFRRRSLTHAAGRLRERGDADEGGVAGALSGRNLSGEELDDWVLSEFADGSSGPSHRGRPSVLQGVSPQVRSVIRALASRLRDERERRLEAEEQSSRMIGKQQLALARAEDRLRSMENNRHEGRHSHPRLSRAHTGTEQERRERDGDSFSHDSVSSSSSASRERQRSRARRHRGDEKPLAVSPRSRTRSPAHAEESISSLGALASRPPLPPPTPSSSSAAAPSRSAARSGTASPDRSGLTKGTPQYEDAEAILEDIRRRYKL